MCGGRVLEIGGRDHRLMRGAGVDRVLHTVRTDGITQTGASLISLVSDTPWNRARLTDCCFDGVSDPLTRLCFSGVDLEGVLFCSRPGVVVLVLDGVRVGAPDPFFVGVVTAEDGRVGVPGVDPLADLRVGTVLLASDRSRNVYSFVYTRGGHGG
jgi:hypothetical protein